MMTGRQPGQKCPQRSHGSLMGTRLGAIGPKPAPTDHWWRGARWLWGHCYVTGCDGGSAAGEGDLQVGGDEAGGVVAGEPAAGDAEGGDAAGAEEQAQRVRDAAGVRAARGGIAQGRQLGAVDDVQVYVDVERAVREVGDG